MQVALIILIALLISYCLPKRSRTHYWAGFSFVGVFASLLCIYTKGGVWNWFCLVLNIAGCCVWLSEVLPAEPWLRLRYLWDRLGYGLAVNSFAEWKEYRHLERLRAIEQRLQNKIRERLFYIHQRSLLLIHRREGTL
jgi:hypothetical protein